MASDWNFTQEKKKIVSEIQVVYLMGKIIARQMKQSMTHSNQKEWLETQVSREVRLFAPTFAAIIHCTCSFTHVVTLRPDWSEVVLLTRWANLPLNNQTSQKVLSILIRVTLKMESYLLWNTPSVRNTTFLKAEKFCSLTSWKKEKAHYYYSAAKHACRKQLKCRLLSGNFPLLPYKSLNVKRVPLVSHEGDLLPSLCALAAFFMHKKQHFP